MKFIILSLVINVILLFIPLYSKTSLNQPNNKIQIAVNFTTKNSAIEAINSSVENAQIQKVQPIEAITTTQTAEIVNTKNIAKSQAKSKKSQNLPKNQQSKSKKNLSTNLTPKSGNNFNPNDSFCKENIGFIALNSNQFYKFPKKAIKLGLKGEYRVDVTFQLKGNNIVIKQVKSPNEIFKESAIRYTKQLRFKILKPEVENCLITKPFIFRSN